MDIVVMTHIPGGNGIPAAQLKKVLEALVRATHPKVEAVGFAEGSENREGINAIQIKTGLNKATKDMMEETLKQIFGQKFEISYTKEQPHLNRANDINKVARRFSNSHYS